MYNILLQSGAEQILMDYHQSSANTMRFFKFRLLKYCLLSLFLDTNNDTITFFILFLFLWFLSLNLYIILLNCLFEYTKYSYQSCSSHHVYINHVLKVSLHHFLISNDTSTIVLFFSQVVRTQLQSSVKYCLDRDK